MFKKQNKRPTISFYNKYLINTIDTSKDNEININNSFILPYNNPLSKLNFFNKTKKEIILAKLDTSHLQKKKKNKKEEDHLCNKTINYDDSEGLIMAAKLSSSFMTDRNNYDSKIYYPKKKIKSKKEIDNNTNKTKEKSSYTSDNDIFEISPLEKYNIQNDAISKIQSIWRMHNIRGKIMKKIKIFNFRKIINKFVYKKNFNKIFNNKNIKEKIYLKKVPEKNKILINYEIINKNNYFKKNELQIEEKINEITILDNNQKKHIQRKLKEEEYNKKYNKNSWIKFPFCIEKFIKKKIIFLHYNFFIENLKQINKEKLKEKQKLLLYKLIHSNNIRNIKIFFKRYKEKIIIEKTRQNIYNSLIKSKQKEKNKQTISFNFQYFYKQNILRDIIKKYRYKSVVQKYYFLWKKKFENKNKIIENKRRKFIKIKRVKKNEKQNNDFNLCKEETISNFSGISNNFNNCNNNNASIESISIQSIKYIKGCLPTTNKKMRIKKIIVDHNYYEYIENNNNYYSNYK